MKSTYDVVAIVVVRRFEADNKCWPSLKKMALQTDLSNLRLHPALITPLRSNNSRAQIWEKIRRRAGKCPPRRRNDGAHQGTVKKEDAGRLRHHRYPLGWAQVLALDRSEKSGGPPGSGPPARGRTSSNDHRHDRGKRPCLELAQQLQAIVASCAHLYERSLINPSQFQTETLPAASNVYGWL
jgi:hypothetical protein